MYALAAQKLPEGKKWLYEVKFDGYRCLAGRDKSGITLWSRRGNDFTSQFPHIARACERLPAGTLLDGEIIALDKNGRIEGVIAKRKDSLYESGKRTGAWVKYKIHQGQEFVIGGYVPDHPFDSIIVGYYREDKLYYAGRSAMALSRTPGTKHSGFERTLTSATSLPAQGFQSLLDKLQRCSSTTWELLKSRCQQSMRPWVVMQCTFVCLLASRGRT
jgi:ATP-dependent DNA ligase